MLPDWEVAALQARRQGRFLELTPAARIQPGANDFILGKPIRTRFLEQSSSLIDERAIRVL